MADDTTSFLKYEKSLRETLDTLEKFREYAGLRLNLSKSEVMWLGSKKRLKYLALWAEMRQRH